MVTSEVLRPQQLAFFDTFGFLALPGLFRDDIAELTEAFEAIFTDESIPQMSLDVELHRNEPRFMIPKFIDRHPVLAALGEIPEIYGVDGPSVPCTTLPSEPGDLLMWDFRTLHASYGGHARRRLFTLNFRQGPDPRPVTTVTPATGIPG